ncbi:MAG: DUF1465 family protein [Alphaproteobacteria bacterium]|nr:DUF1465 family protein [Alphaproteobacteria bacterium]MDX5367959.1 DUF1465 family protein [Alphaproteobacteria bacterium]MDX5462812.1 DUF1465 family protein [Alphaproteobacteria bacterium]
MSDQLHTVDTERRGAEMTAQIGARQFASSAVFYKTFDEAMALVQETAAYLDGQGRFESQDLGRDCALVYAAESMRLTTRLMQVSSWLLAQRALQKGQIAFAEASGPKYRLSMPEPSVAPNPRILSQLPDRFVTLVSRSRRLYARVKRIDTRLYCDGARLSVAEPPLAHHIRRIEAAFAPPQRVEAMRPLARQSSGECA